LQTVTGDVVSLAYLALQIVKCQDKQLVIRCLASAVAILYKDDRNLTGSPRVPESLTGLLPDYTDKTSAVVVQSNLEDAVDITEGELAQLLDIDTDELAAYFGVLFLAGVKKVTKDNRTAFNEKRAEMVRTQILGEPVIFLSGSQYLTDQVLHKVYATFMSMASPRCHLVKKTSEFMGDIHIGPQTAFTAMFLLLVDTGMGAIRVIKEAVLKYPWLRTDFPELRPEYAAANRAQLSIRQADVSMRPFLKAVFGNSYVPVSQSEINNLFGLCKYVLSKSQTTYVRYNGGSYTDEQEAKALARLGETAATE